MPPRPGGSGMPRLPALLGLSWLTACLMCLPWLGFHAVRKRLGNTLGYTPLFSLWLSFEYFHLQDWGLSWPWLTIGNVFAAHPDWVQWYEYTGTSGGGLWILVVNILLFQLLWHKIQREDLSHAVCLDCTSCSDPACYPLFYHPPGPAGARPMSRGAAQMSLSFSPISILMRS